MSEINFLDRITFHEYPFFWDLNELTKDSNITVIDDIETKMKEIGVDCERRFIYDLILSYEYAKKGEVDKSEKYLKNCNILEENDFFNTYEAALTNILSACWAHLEFLKENLSEAVHHLEKVRDLVMLSPEQQAAIWAVRAFVTMNYSPEGTRKSLEFARKALQLNDSETKWHLLMGKLLSRIRHFDSVYPPPSEEEFQHFEVAMTLEESSETAVFLAGSYLDFTTVLWRRNKSCDKDVVDYYQKKAYNLLCRAVELELIGSHVLIRCARAFTRLPRSFNATELALKLMYEALKKAPDDLLVNHYSGLICIKSKKLAEAVRYLTVALDGGIDKAIYSLIDVNHQLNPDFDVAPLYRKVLSIIKNVSKKQLIHLHATGYYLILKQNLLKAVEHLIEAIVINPNNPILKDFKAGFNRSGMYNISVSSDNLTLLSCVCNDVKYTLSHNSCWYKSEDQEKMKSLIELLKNIIPDEVAKEPVKISVKCEKGRTSANVWQKGYGKKSGVSNSYKETGRRMNINTNWRKREPCQQSEMSNVTNNISQQLEN